MRMIFNELFTPDLNKIVTKPNPSDRELIILIDALNRDLEKKQVQKGIYYFKDFSEPDEKAKDCWKGAVANTIKSIRNGMVFNHYEGFQSYVKAVNRNIIFAELKKNQIDLKMVELENDIDKTVNTEIELDKLAEKFVEKLGLLKGLGEKCKELFTFRFFDDMEVKEIAKKFNAPPNTISKSLRRCIDKIKENNNENDIKDLLN